MSRLPKNNHWDVYREPADATLFPYYYSDVVFAALGMTLTVNDYYGDVAVQLREAHIADRASVFEENSRLFLEKKDLVGRPVPPGYRATWSDRADLCVAKLFGAVSQTTTEGDYQGILVKGDGEDLQFVEVHIHGGLHRSSFERVAAKPPSTDSEEVFYRSLANACDVIGVEIATS